MKESNTLLNEKPGIKEYNMHHVLHIYTEKKEAKLIYATKSQESS